MLFMILLLWCLNAATLCHSLAIDNFAVTNPAKWNENVWVNCSGHMDTTQEEFEGIELLKDGEQFYIYRNNETNRDDKIRTTSVNGIDRTQIETFINYTGCVRIKYPTESIKGRYQCRYHIIWIVFETKFYRWIDSESQYINSVIVEPIDDNKPTNPPPTYNDTAVIHNFDVSHPIIVGDDFSLNCTPSLITGQSLVSLTFSKDNATFYNYSDNKVNPHTVPGINIFQISYPKNSVGNVIINAANSQASGVYKCELTIRSLNGTTISANLVKNIHVTNKWSPDINSFDTPSVITKSFDFWINCTYYPTISEKLVSLNLSKDGEIFYSYSNDKIHVSTKSAINVYKIITPKQIGSVKIESAIESYKGMYRCSVTAQKINGAYTTEGTTSSEAYIDYTDVKNNYISDFQVPSNFGKGDDLLIYCSLALESGVTLTSLTISKDERVFYTYKSSSGRVDVNRLNEIPDINQIKTNKEQIGLVSILYATQELKGNYKCDVTLLSTKTGAVFDSVSKYVDYTDEWKPEINRFYVPDIIVRGISHFWANCSAGLTAEEISNFLLTMTKDSETFYNISSKSIATTYPVRGLESYQFDTTGQYNGSVRIENPTMEAKGIYRCTLTTTRGAESKTVYIEYFVNRANALITTSTTSMYYVITIVLYFYL